MNESQTPSPSNDTGDINHQLNDLEAPDPPVKKSPPNIVICSDGTWNQGGAVNPTNVWRTFTVVSPENQIKYHDNGVGAEGIQLMQLIGGAFGFGISKNLCELLAFVIQAYEPGSKIYLFGFSRGAFTVRVLADILCIFGIPNKSGLRTAEDVERVAAEMLHAYKDEKTIKRSSAESTATIAGLLEESAQTRTSSTVRPPESNIAKFRAKYSCHVNNRVPDDQADTLEAIAESAPGPAHLIHFLGCWDTVEALGIPFEPLKKVAIHFFPLKFRDNIPNPKIRTVCHALSLDDERRAFHPLCFTNVAAPGQTIHQTWFPGNHCHVGGGYSRDQMAMVPLEWMLDHARKEGLEINEEQLEDILSTRFTHGQLPSARAGMNFFYGYHPRRIDEFQQSGPWSVHVSAFERLGKQIQTYLPTAMLVHHDRVDANTFDRIPDHYDGEAPDELGDCPVVFVDGGGKYMELDMDQDLWIPQYVPLSKVRDYSEKMDHVNERNIWLGKALWWICLLFVILMIAFGYTNRMEPGSNLLPSSFSVLYGVEKLALETIASVVPGSLNQYVLQGFLNRPGSLTLWSLAGTILLIACRRNRRIVEQFSFDAWLKTPAMAFKQRDGAGSTTNQEGGLAAYHRLTFRWFVSSVWNQLIIPPIDFTMRLLSKAVPSVRAFTGALGAFFVWCGKQLFQTTLLSLLVAGFASVILALVLGVLIDYSYRYNKIAQDGAKTAIRLVPGQLEEATEIFKANEIAFSTGVWVEKGARYQVKVTPVRRPKEDDPNEQAEALPWKDGSRIEASPDGFDVKEKANGFIFRFRQYPQEEMFQVLARIAPTVGGRGQKAYPIGKGNEFLAEEDGLLILFVNDVKGFYVNNRGHAKVTVKRLSPEPSSTEKELPTAPPKE